MSRSVMSLNRFRFAKPLAAVTLAVLASSTTTADEFTLKSGSRLTGRPVDTDSADRGRVMIDLLDGGRVTIKRSQIESHSRQSPAEAEYARRSPGVADTAESHMRIARWCREQRMAAESRRRLHRVIELDPTHDEAHRMLGHHKVGDRWLTRGEVMASRGMIRHDGEYRTRQEAELLERAQRGKELAAGWRSQLAQWRRWLTGKDPAKSAEAEEAFESLDSPGAAPALAAMLGREQNAGVRVLLIGVAARIEHPAAVQALVGLSLDSPDEEVRLLCVEQLVRARRPGLAAPYVATLRSNDYQKVNRAAEALGEIGSADAISPLIDALVTVHQQKVGNDSGGDSYQFTPSNGGFQFGGNGPKVVKAPRKNPKALSALVRLTEGRVNFGYDQPQWKSWLASRAEADVVDLRRDP